MTTQRPNILWYCTDQQRFGTIGVLGNPHVRTPAIDRLVAEGVAFTAAYCQSPICTPSRSSFMTGLYPSRVHNTRNGNDTFPDHPPLIRSLIGILKGEADPGNHREFARCEYFDSLDTHFTGGSGSFATMFREKRFKLCMYRGHGLGELYDLKEDSWEFENLWDDPGYADVRNELICQSFDAHVLLTTHVGSRRIAPM